MKARPPVTEQRPIAYELEELGEIIRVRRDVLRLNQVDASARAGVSMYVMSRLENGKAVRTDSLVKVFRGLGLAVAARAVNRTGFTLPPLDKAQHEVAGGPVPGIEPSNN
jgi:transcriptional regulator with XRE-family HTH domain